MNNIQLLKKLLPGMFPLIVFIIIDEIYGTAAGLITAISFGAAQLIYTYARNRVLDKFTLYDTLLIIALGGISFLLNNDIFFKLKPGLIGIIMCILLGVSAFSKLNIVELMSRKYLGNLEISEAQSKQFRKNIQILFFIFLIHTALIFYSAFFMSKEAWAFVSVALLYIVIGLFVLYQLLMNALTRRRYGKEEWVPIVDESGKITGKAPRSVAHTNKDLLHPVVHLHVINRKKEIYLQKRSAVKLEHPGKWDTAVAGHVGLNETIEAALLREAKEELGLTDFKAVPLKQYVSRMENQSELVFLLYTIYNGDLTINKDEIEEGRFWKAAEIRNALGSGIFTPDFEEQFAFLHTKKIV